MPTAGVAAFGGQFLCSHTAGRGAPAFVNIIEKDPAKDKLNLC